MTHPAKLLKSLEQRANAMAKGAKAAGKSGKAPAKGTKAKAQPKSGKAPGKGAKSKAGKAPPGARSAQTGIVQLEGDATKVLFAMGKKRLKVPGPVPAGKYKILAAFGTADLKEAGAITVEPKKTKVVSCSGTSMRCSVAQ